MTALELIQRDPNWVNVIWGVALVILIIGAGLARRARRRGGAYTAGVAGVMTGIKRSHRRAAADRAPHARASVQRG
jgi:hypothetical protein